MRIVNQRGPRTGADTPAAVALGLFDGVHTGHAAVLAAARRHALQNGLRLAVFTFSGGQKGQKHIFTEAQKHEQLAALGVETCYEPPFESFRALAPEGFFKDMLLGEYNARALFCGENFGFGAHRAGDTGLLRTLAQQNGTTLAVVPMALYEGEPVSSSRIRAALAAGRMEDVNAMLGRPYEIDYPVQHGKQLGGKLGFPTINQLYPADIQPPAHGVYATQTLLDGVAWVSATGYGTRPSVDNGAPSCETFIPGYEGDLYGKNVRVRFYTKLDDPRKFDSFDALAAAVRGWAKASAEYFGEDGVIEI